MAPWFLLIFALAGSLHGAGERFWSEGQVSVLSAPLTRQERRHVSGPSYPFPGDLQLAIAVPRGFSAERSYPMLFVSVTGDRYRTNIEELDALKADSLDFYARIRSLYRQNRESEINNGAPSGQAPNFTDVPGQSTSSVE